MSTLFPRRVRRSEIELINFGNLRGVDPIEALGDRGLIRKMSSTYIFQPIEPLTQMAGTD